MSDPIDRQAAIAYAISGMTREIDGDKWIRVSEVRESIKTMPSAQPEIIMCKDCKWWDFAPDNTMLPDWHRCRWYGRMHTRYDDFCSRAERRE